MLIFYLFKKKYIFRKKVNKCLKVMKIKIYSNKKISLKNKSNKIKKHIKSTDLALSSNKLTTKLDNILTKLDL